MSEKLYAYSEIFHSIQGEKKLYSATVLKPLHGDGYDLQNYKCSDW